MGYLKGTGRALGGGLLAIIALSGCAEKVYDYSGEYEFLVGRDCTLLDSSTENTLEVAAASDSSAGRGYRVRLPIAARMELPAISAQASPNDAGELTVFFNKEKDGMMGYQNSQTMVMTLVPHPSKPDHLWLTRWTLSAQNNLGASDERDMLDLLLKSSRGQAESSLTESIDLTNRHACLGKKSRLTLTERTALEEETVRQQEQLMADQVSRLRALSFEEFQAIDPGCNMTPATPVCRAYFEQAGQRRAAEKERELERLSGLSDTALEAEGRSCYRSREPRCLAIAEIAAGRRTLALAAEKSRLVTMSYSAFADHKRVSCASDRTEECKMYRSLEDQKWREEIARLLSVYDGEELVNLEWSACNSASPTYREDRHQCNQRREVTRIKRSHQAQYYEERPDELRKTYNACIEELDNLTTARNSKESQDIRYTFRCSTALDGARKSGIRDVFKTRM
jgi:hypothetical protein